MAGQVGFSSHGYVETVRPDANRRKKRRVVGEKFKKVVQIKSAELIMNKNHTEMEINRPI